MEKNIKGEFKDFISTLSTEICKQVLLEELNGINNSFEKTEKDYKNLYENYTKNINSIKEELAQLQCTNRKLGEFITNINNNNIKINKALDVINGEHKIITDKIIKDNDKLFNKFSTKVKSLNTDERNKFITQLTSSINSQSKKYASELGNIVNKSKIEDIKNNLTLVSNKVNEINNDLMFLVNKVDASEKVIITSVKDEISENERNLMSKIKVTNLRFDKISSELDDKIEALVFKIDKNNNTIIALASVIIFLCIVLIFRN